MVNSTADGTANVANCAVGNANTCRLRDAIVAINGGQATGTTITFDATAFPPATPQTITLNANVGSLTLSASMTINGSGHRVTIDGGCTLTGASCSSGGVTIFQINGGVTATLTTLTIQHGRGAPSFTGGILVNSGATLTLSTSTLTGNAANAANGGAIFNSGTLTVIDSTLTSNTATSGAGGGAIRSGGGRH